MAGIGFELRKLLRKDSYFGLLRAYGYAGIISSGPWVLSILVIMAIGLLALGLLPDRSDQIWQFLVSVTYLVAASLCLSGLAQLIFTRFVADRLFEQKHGIILPNLLGLLTVMNLLAAAVGLTVLLTLFGGTPLLYQVEMFVGFVLLTNIWCITVFITGMKAYRQVLWAFFIGYSVTFILGMALRRYDLEGLLGGFVIGQGILCYILLFLVLRYYPGDRIAAFDLRRANLTFRSLIFTGLFYNLGIWADKFLFWYNPATSEHVIGPLRASPIYDFPIFLAYLSIVPGMAVFLIRMETDFAERYDAYYNAVREGDTLSHIELRLDRMVETVRQGVYDIFKIQGITVVALLLVAPSLIDWLGFSPYYVPLFNIDIVAVGIQVLFMAILNVLLYLDKLKIVLVLCVLFFVSNVLLTLLSMYLGAIFYGYGFAVSLMISSLAGLAMLDREFQNLTYQTFMLQRQS